MDVRSPVNIVVRYEMYPKLIDDFWFTYSAWWARLMDNIQPFTGGLFTKSVFRFRPMPASFYRMGATHDITKVKTLGEANFGIRYAQVSIPEFKEELQVIAKGPEAVFSLLDEDLENGLASLTDLLAVSAWGEDSSDDTELTGLATLIGDGIHPSWNGFIAGNYGGASRTGEYRSQLNSNIYWGGQPNGKAGPLSYPLFGTVYSACSHGPYAPDLILTSKEGYNFLLNQIEPQYRYMNETRDPYWGGDGLRYRNAYVMVDEKIPSASGLTDEENYGLGGYKTEAFTNVLTGTPGNNFPNSTQAATLEPAEIYIFLTTEGIVLRMSDDPEYGLGFSGFMGTPDSEKVVGRIKFAGNLQGIGRGPRYQGLLMGINS